MAIYHTANTKNKKLNMIKVRKKRGNGKHPATGVGTEASIRSGVSNDLQLEVLGSDNSFTTPSCPMKVAYYESLVIAIR